jgi:hypothetical protein
VGQGIVQDVRHGLGRKVVNRHFGKEGHQASTGVVVEKRPGCRAWLSQTQRLPRKVVGVGGASDGFCTRVFGDSLARALAAGLLLLRGRLFWSHK